MQEKEIYNKLIEAKAILKGHFILSSGLHSDTYIQCAKIMMNSNLGELLCNQLAKKIIDRLGNDFADIVVSPAMGAVIIGYEVGRQLNLPSIFCERVNKIFELRRGFEINKGVRVLIVEDVITTGISSLETYELVRKFGGKIVGEASLINRYNGNVEEKLGVPVISLLNLNVKTFENSNIPEELRDIPAIKPGSRFISN